MELGPLEASDVVRDITGVPPLNVMGYCIGGTLLAMALAWLATQGDKRFNSATFMVSLQDFSRVGDTAIFLGEDRIDFIEQQMMERGYLDSREMSNMFNLLRSNDLIWANVVNNYLLGEKPPAFDLLYWNSDGTRMCRGRPQLVPAQHLCREQPDRARQDRAEGPADRPRLIKQDVYAVGAEKDHIVPWEAAWRITQLLERRRALRAGVQRPHRRHDQSAGRQGRLLDRRSPASRPPPREEWRESRGAHGSWWTDWFAWLAKRSGKKVEPPALGSARTRRCRMPRQLRPGKMTAEQKSGKNATSGKSGFADNIVAYKNWEGSS